jgi:anti-sigma regulatory factor (Ser/Thr protein kinase)
VEAVTAVLTVADRSYVSGARRESQDLARRIGLGADDVGRAGLIATEMATNLAKHGGGGSLLVQPLPMTSVSGLELIAIDRGPGIADIARSLRDGVSTYGSAGTGLGAIRRQADEFDIYSAPARGAAVLARIWPQRRLPPAESARIGAITVAKPEEKVCGDSFGVTISGMTVSAMMVDGLGHGVAAHDAAEEARRLFQRGFQSSPIAAVRTIHAGLRATRGGAVAVLTLDLAASRLAFCGLGNIAGLAAAGGNVRRFVSMNGIAGHTAERLQEFIYPCDGPGLVVVLHSDGLSTNWSLDRYAGLAGRHPSLIAAVLYRDLSRGRDDSAVLVIKRAA